MPTQKVITARLQQAERECSETQAYTGTRNALLHVCTLLESYQPGSMQDALTLSRSLPTPTSEHARYAREEQAVYTRYIGYLV